MIVLGVDPGTRCTGYGIVEKRGNMFLPLAYGGILTADGDEISRRLKTIYDGLMQVIATQRPQAMALEKAFFSKSIASAFRIGEARAIAMLCAAQSNLPLAEYEPRLVKMSVVGSGAAHKQQVQQMVKRLLGLHEDPKPIDASDALAIAICHCQRAETAKRLGL
jgi:crossover junction endodeoxyribonuclease RuvC